MFKLFTKGGTRRRKQSRKNKKSRKQQRRYRGGEPGFRNGGQEVTSRR